MGITSNTYLVLQKTNIYNSPSSLILKYFGDAGAFEKYVQWSNIVKKCAVSKLAALCGHHRLKSFDIRPSNWLGCLNFRKGALKTANIARQIPKLCIILLWSFQCALSVILLLFVVFSHHLVWNAHSTAKPFATILSSQESPLQVLPMIWRFKNSPSCQKLFRFHKRPTSQAQRLPQNRP